MQYDVETDSVDANGNGIPDECECLADCAAPADDQVDVTDLLTVLGEWGQAGGDCDTDGDGLVDVMDLLRVLGAWGACPSG